MCGIVGCCLHTAKNKDALAVKKCLQSLEYRGYDSCGILTVWSAGTKNQAVACEKSLDCVEACHVPKFVHDEETADKQRMHRLTMLAHTRWATHGRPTLENTHPVQMEDLHIVHNGVVENFLALKKRFNLECASDTRLVAHLCQMQKNDASPFDLARLRKALAYIENSSYALAVYDSATQQLFLCQLGTTPLVLGHSPGKGYFFASDSDALPSCVQKLCSIENNIVVLKNGELCHSNGLQWKKCTKNDNAETGCNNKARDLNTLWSAPSQEKTLHEIEEQPALLQTLRKHYATYDWPSCMSQINQLIFIGCGSSYYAASSALYMIKDTAVNVRVERATVFADRFCPHNFDNQETMVVFLSQSGETADILRISQQLHALSIKFGAIVNCTGSALAKSAHFVWPTLCGKEVGVASTKSFSAQIFVIKQLLHQFCLLQFADDDSKAVNHLPQKIVTRQQSADLKLMDAFSKTFELRKIRSKAADMAEQLARHDRLLVLGRHLDFVLAQEAALKIQELCYMFCIALHAAELKHGPLALVEPDLCCLIFAHRNDAKMQVCAQQIEARGGRVLTFYYDGCLGERIAFLQYLAVFIAQKKGNNVDRPRNLAKSVTVQ